MTLDCGFDYSSSKICNSYYSTAAKKIVLKKRLPSANEMERKVTSFFEINFLN